ncbi:hypothetical protein HYH03_002440 [Edaphochlamys debaryana]|uniref:RING-type domain-containing protein n=1 Tax=Edaphochlamys debaryana TaxID=47281 RepID=A0A835YDZ2_9CHLO|nr:hypothetical protein HYH03_002440 [Edaphochlamys debaryana]|eukprot:KAG2499493.1 hypothetical protein HYH03_002440 [Edaphochlamys debaryana]
MGCSSSTHAVAPAPGSDQADKPQPVTPDSRVLRGQAYYTAGKVAEALKEFNATIATWPTYARAYLERGNVRLDQKDFAAAVGDYTMALQLQGNLLQAYVMRCHARMALRQYNEALQDVREAERLDPENAQVKALKAQVRKAQAGGGGALAAAAAAAAAAAGGLVVPGAGSGGPGSEDEDAFAGVDTPKSTPSPSVRKLCMVCMDAERECRLRPCMHAALCVECAEGLMARGYGCPICSCKIEQVEKGAFMRTFTVEEAQGIAAAARITASPGAPSPGKSPLGRRFAPQASMNGPSLDNIAEVDEEAHAAADAAADAARAASTGSGAGTPRDALAAVASAPAPPVTLEPHPLAARSARSIAAQLESAATPPAAAAAAAAASVASTAPAWLPGAVESIEEEPAAADGAPSLAGGLPSGLAAEVAAAAQRGDEGLVLSPGTSAHMANSLADWIDQRQSNTGASGGVASFNASLRLPSGGAAALAPAAAGPGPGPQLAAAGSGGVRGSFEGFALNPAAGSMPSAVRLSGPVGEGCHSRSGSGRLSSSLFSSLSIRRCREAGGDGLTASCSGRQGLGREGSGGGSGRWAAGLGPPGPGPAGRCSSAWADAPLLLAAAGAMPALDSEAAALPGRGRLAGLLGRRRPSGVATAGGRGPLR